MRGSDVVQHLQGSSTLTAAYHPCKGVNRTILCSNDVYVHIKHACQAALSCHGKHIMDTVDRPPEHGFDGHIFETDTQLRADCASQCCAAIPHLFNLKCRPSKLQASEKIRGNGSVAVLGWHNATTTLGVFESLRPFVDLPLQQEPQTDRFSRLCSWYETHISVAIAWKTNNKSKGACERFTNPIWLNLPTIGHVFYDCQREFDPEGTFLCGNTSCINRTIQSFRAGLLDEPFQRLVDRVKRATNAEALRKRYASFFSRCARGETVRQRIDGSTVEVPLQGHSTEPLAMRGLASSPKPAQCIEGKRAHLRYTSSKLEHQWLSWPDGAAGHICEIAALQLSEAHTWLAFTKRAWNTYADAAFRVSTAAVPQRSPRMHRPLLPVNPNASEVCVVGLPRWKGVKRCG